MPPPASSELIANDGSGTAASISTPAQSSTIEDQLKCMLTSMAEKDPTFLSNLLQPQTRATPADIDGTQSSSSFTLGEKPGKWHSLPFTTPSPHALVIVDAFLLLLLLIRICAPSSVKKKTE